MDLGNIPQDSVMHVLINEPLPIPIAETLRVKSAVMAGPVAGTTHLRQSATVMTGSVPMIGHSGQSA